MTNIEWRATIYQRALGWGMYAESWARIDAENSMMFALEQAMFYLWALGEFTLDSGSYVKYVVPTRWEASTRRMSMATKKAAKKAAPKAAKKATAPKASAPGKRDADRAQTVHLKQKDNPYREGSAGFKTFELLSKKKTLGEVLAAGGDRGYVRHAVARKYVSLSAGKS